MINLVIHACDAGVGFGMRSASVANASMPMMNAAGLGLGASTPSLYSINNMAASLLAQSKFCGKPTQVLSTIRFAAHFRL